MSTAPCVHPTCSDEDGNHRLTQDVMCYPCRGHYRRQLGWLIEDYIMLKSTLATHTGDGRSTRDSYGHPAEWASDTCADIAGLLNDAEDALRAHLGDKPAPSVGGESQRVNHAHAYLSPRFDAFCTFPRAGDYAAMVADTHRTVRAWFGLNRLVEHLPLPCPSCDVASLTQEVGRITCGNESCGRVIREEDYPMLARIASQWAMDALIEQYDAQHTEDLTDSSLAVQDIRD